MTDTKIYDRRLRQAIIEVEATSNNWDGGLDPEELAEYKYAVTINRDDDSWVLGANNDLDIARIHLACAFDTEGYDEWVEEIVDLDTGKTYSSVSNDASPNLVAFNGGVAGEDNMIPEGKVRLYFSVDVEPEGEFYTRLKMGEWSVARDVRFIGTGEPYKQED